VKAILIRAAFTLVLCAGAANAQTETAREPAAAPPDYRLDANWLCRPDREDACAQDLTTTVIAADGAMTRETFTPNPNSAIDCFYVYPTVSLDQTGNSDLNPGPEERLVALVQLARFRAECRTFAPMYRQGTLASLRARMNGVDGPSGDRALAYSDVLAAWRHYLAHDNQGRGVVLISHSQGTVVLDQLIKEEIDGKPIQAQLVSAILLGANVVVPNGADTGGTFQSVPGCRSDNQTGCVISFVTFRADAPPPADGIFGIAMDPLSPRIYPDSHALCTNPANLEGGLTPLRSYFQTDLGPWTPPGFAWAANQQEIDTPFVSLPGLLSGECVSTGRHTYLAIHIHAGENDVRTHDIPGDVIVQGRLFPDWGLHRVDVHLAIGDLVELVGRQSAAYAARHQ